MKEISALIKELKGYPPNFFICPQDNTEYDGLDNQKLSGKVGLAIVDKDGNPQGFIETGTNNGEVVI